MPCQTHAPIDRRIDAVTRHHISSTKAVTLQYLLAVVLGEEGQGCGLACHRLRTRRGGSESDIRQLQDQCLVCVTQ